MRGGWHRRGGNEAPEEGAADQGCHADKEAAEIEVLERPGATIPQGGIKRAAASLMADYFELDEGTVRHWHMDF